MMPETDLDTVSKQHIKMRAVNRHRSKQFRADLFRMNYSKNDLYVLDAQLRKCFLVFTALNSNLFGVFFMFIDVPVWEVHVGCYLMHFSQILDDDCNSFKWIRFSILETMSNCDEQIKKNISKAHWFAVILILRFFHFLIPFILNVFRVNSFFFTLNTCRYCARQYE